MTLGVTQESQRDQSHVKVEHTQKCFLEQGLNNKD